MLRSYLLRGSHKCLILFAVMFMNGSEYYNSFHFGLSEMDSLR
uniref:Uncharacterized protein n=1 Tax=Nymphaea colorata TaxID=210225 RepID=A0A5K1B0P4_9MAGN